MNYFLCGLYKSLQTHSNSMRQKDLSKAAEKSCKE